MNLNSHSPAQIIKLLPDLDARYRKAQEELAAAQVNLNAATKKVEEAEQVLTEALGRLLGNFPEHVILKARAIHPTTCERDQVRPEGTGSAPTRPPFPGEPGSVPEPDNGAGPTPLDVLDT